MGLILAIVSTLVSITYWPGQIDPDTLDEIHGAATGQFNDWHTPILSSLWRIPFLIGFRSPGWVLVATIFTFLIGFYLILRVRFSRVASTILAIVCLAYPPVLSWGIHIGRDTWFSASLVCAMGFAARTARMGNRSKRINFTVSIAMAFICSASRQDGIVVVAVLFMVWAALMLPAGLSHRWISRIAVGTVAAVLLFGGQSLLLRTIHTKVTHPEQALYEYDLAQLSHAEGKDLFPPALRMPHQNTMAALQAVVPGTYDTLVWGKSPVIRAFLGQANVVLLRSKWENAILHDPEGYLKERTALIEAQLSITKPSAWIFEPGNAVGFPPLSTALEHAGLAYLRPFGRGGSNTEGGPLYTVWVYVLILMISIPVLWHRKKRPDLVVMALSLSMFVYLATLFIASPDLVYRFAYPFVVVATVTAPVLLPRLHIKE